MTAEVKRNINPEPTEPEKKSFDTLFIHSENARIGVNPQGGYITSWQIKNPEGDFEDILYKGSELKRTGIPILFPYYGEGGDKGDSHGFGRKSDWVIDEGKSTANKVFMKLSSDKISEKAREKYPFPFEAEIIVEAAEDGGLIYNLVVVNKGKDDLPLTPGLHPYWAIAHQDKASITIDGISGFDAKNIDWDKTPPDTVYDYSGKATISIPGKQIGIEDISGNGPVVKHIVVWSQTPEEADYNLICVEPVCGDDSDINNNPILLRPNETWNMKIRLSAVIDPKAA